MRQFEVLKIIKNQWAISKDHANVIKHTHSIPQSSFGETRFTSNLGEHFSGTDAFLHFLAFFAYTYFLGTGQNHQNPLMDVALWHC
jgi:hypothetical protein